MPMEYHLFAIVVLLKNEVASESWKDHYPWYLYENSSETFSCPVYSSEIFWVNENNHHHKKEQREITCVFPTFFV